MDTQIHISVPGTIDVSFNRGANSGPFVSLSLGYVNIFIGEDAAFALWLELGRRFLPKEAVS